MAVSCCPTCGRKFTTRKAQSVTDPATLTDRELFAHYKRTAPHADLAFWVNGGPYAPDVDRAFAALLLECFDSNNELRIQRTEFYRRLNAAKALWRKWSNDEQRKAGDPAIGSPEWQKALRAAAASTKRRTT
jgi:hypothetical protein